MELKKPSYKDRVQPATSRIEATVCVVVSLPY
jgi:hypothetical protein